MQTYRAYLLDDQGKITWGDWIEAANENEALTKARKLCRHDSPFVELWLGARRLGTEPCSEGATPEVAPNKV